MPVDEPEVGLGADSGPWSGGRAGDGGRSGPLPRPVRRPGSRQSDDEFEGPGLLSRPLVVGPVALGVAALVIIPLVVLGSGGSDDGGNQEQAAGSSASAEASPSLTAPPRRISPPPPVTTSPSAEDDAKDKDKDKGKDKPKPKDTTGTQSGGGVTVTVTATAPGNTTTVTAKPPQDTAATAVKRLAASDPSGRHICYRAYVSGRGWQKPVCDGTMAGTTGQNRPIKALNIAVHGVDGSAGNAFRHSAKPVDGRGEWQPSWTAVTGNGKNYTIGSPKKDAPNMLGFALNVGSGEICNTIRLRQRDWGGRVCSRPRPDFVFGGTLENDVWLEAVKLTV
ncbi:hydrogenase expression protein HypA [Streptomyces sp. PDY-4]|uniref:hydrogenase expression protein HypA n=1 Tax=Streptomyces sp. PDY-4 TaxID=3376070 RepID=UPI00379200AD